MKILIVDDNPMNLEVLRQTLQIEDFELESAQNGEECLQAALRLRPDLVLLDILMPDLDGFEVCRQLKANELTHDIPIIFLSAKTESVDVLNGFRCGGVDYITKPFYPDEVLARVKTHLGFRKLVQDKDLLIHDLRDMKEILVNSSSKDGLTELLNRRAIERLMENHCASDPLFSFSVILGDIDHLQSINNSFGPVTGDHLLIHTATVFSEFKREQDILGRWSGKEFILILPDTGLNEAMKIAENFRTHFHEEQPFFNDSPIPLTLSFGISFCAPEASRFPTCVCLARDAVRQAKIAGGDCIKYFSSSG